MGRKGQGTAAGSGRGYSRELLRGNTDSLLLFLIAQQGRIHGYQLIKEARRRSDGYFQFREGTVYPALHKLEADGLVEGQWQAQATGQQRRYYRITAKGKEALDRRLSMWFSFARAMQLVINPQSP